MGVIIERTDKITGRKWKLLLPSFTIACFSHFVEVMREQAGEIPYLLPEQAAAYAEEVDFFAWLGKNARRSQAELVRRPNPAEVIREILVASGHDVNHASIDAVSCGFDQPCYQEGSE